MRFVRRFDLRGVGAAMFVAFGIVMALGHGSRPFAGMADVLAVEAMRTGAEWRFEVTVLHADEGWDHFADAWRVVGPDGTVYARRTLHHPHVSEQPFTRSLGGVRIPRHVDTVLIEAHDSLHGWGGKRVRITLERPP